MNLLNSDAIVSVGRTDKTGESAYEVENVREMLRIALCGREARERDYTRCLSELIRPGDRVLIKPNWVMHKNHAGHRLDCLVTHPAIIEEVLRLALAAGPSEVVIGDAPIQGCDFEALMKAYGYRDRILAASKGSARVQIKDFRRTVLKKGKFGWRKQTDIRDMNQYVLFDLGRQSLLENISSEAGRFRVTMYDPKLMRETHAPGRHQYLIAREAIEANVVINIPKLKTHKKSGVTGALKNLVGINGNKDFLPHHRKGGSGRGGDCYEGASLIKSCAEHIFDIGNQIAGVSSVLMQAAGAAATRLGTWTSDDGNIEGSWYGNDTIWRTCLDLNRIVRYGTIDGHLQRAPARKILSITDAIICGDHEGPIAPKPYPLRCVTAALNAATAEYVHSYLMGMDWKKLPIVYNAFGQFEYPVTETAPGNIVLFENGERVVRPWPRWQGACIPPKGWIGHCELET